MKRIFRGKGRRQVAVVTQDQAPQGELYFTPLTPSEREGMGTMMGCSADLVEKGICELKGGLW